MLVVFSTIDHVVETTSASPTPHLPRERLLLMPVLLRQMPLGLQRLHRELRGLLLGAIDEGAVIPEAGGKGAAVDCHSCGPRRATS